MKIARLIITLKSGEASEYKHLQLRSAYWKQKLLEFILLETLKW